MRSCTETLLDKIAFKAPPSPGERGSKPGIAIVGITTKFLNLVTLPLTPFDGL